jgi:hypothetical protein
MLTELHNAFMFQQNAHPNPTTKVGNKCLENVAKFKYLEMTIINKNSINAEITSISVTEFLLPFGPESCLSICHTE